MLPETSDDYLRQRKEIIRMCYLKHENLEGKLNKEPLHEKDSNSGLKRDFKDYTHMEAQTFKETIIQNMNSIKQCIVERANHEQELHNGLKRLNERKLQIQECKVQEVQASDANSGDNDCSRIVSDNGNVQGLENQSNTSRDESSRSRNECNDKSTSGDDTDIRPSYDTEPMVEVPYTAEYNVFAVDTQHSKQSESIINTCVVEKVDSNVLPDSADMCDNEIQTDHNAVECDDERVALANLIANLKLDIDENKMIQKQLKKANASLTQELKECKSTLAETSRTLGESNSIRDSCLVALQNKQTEFERYKAFNDRTVDYDKLERKLNETLGLLAQKEIDIKEGLKVKAYEISVVKEKHDELVKQSLLTKSHYEGLVKEKTKIPHDQSDPANRLVPDREETRTLEKESRSKLNKDLVKPFDCTKDIVDQAWVKHSKDHFRAPTAKDMEILIKTCLMSLALKTQNDSFAFVHELKKEMHADLKYVESLENEIDELESDKAEFSNMYDMLLQECVSNDVMCSYLHSLSDLDAHAELQCLYDHKVKECECLAQKLSKQTESVSKEVYTELLQSFAKLEKHSISLELALQQCQEQMKNDTNNCHNELKKLIKKNKGKGVDTNFEKQSILGKPPLQPIRNQPVVRQPTAYKSERSQLPRHRIASQVGVSHDLTKPVTPHSWPQVRKSSFAKPYDVNAPGPSRKSPKHVSFQSPRESVGSNDMVHNYYLEEAKKKAQLQKDKALNTKPSVQQSARLPNTANGNKPKPRNFNQQPRNWPPSMSSRVSNRTVNTPGGARTPPRIQKTLLEVQDLVCPTCKKCIYRANHDECILKYLSKVNSRASTQKKDAQSHKTTKRYILVEKKSNSKNHARQIPIGQKFSPNKSSNVYLKTTPPRSGLTWKPTGRIFTQVSLKWIPIRKSVETRYNTNDSASPLGKETHNPKTVICANSSSLSAGTSMASEPISSKGSSNIDRLSKGKSEKGLVVESFDWDEESVSSEYEGVTKVKAFMAIAEEEPYVGKNDGRSVMKGNMFLTIPMLISIIWRIRGKTCSASSTLLTKELSSCKSELADLKNTKALNFSLQNEIARLNMENESQRHEISDLKKVIEKWTSSKVTIDQLFTKQVPGNIIRALGGRGKKKDTISSKEVLFSKAAESPSETVPEITYDSESECGNLEPLPPLPKLTRAEPIGTSADVLTQTDLTLTPIVSEGIKKNADSSTEKLLLTLMEEVKGLKEQIKIPLDTSLSVSQPGKHPEQASIRKTLAKLKAQSSQGSSLRKAPTIPKPFIDYKYCGLNDHHYDEFEYYPGCDIYGSIAHETANCIKKPASTKSKPRIASQRSNEPTEKYSKESGPKMVFGDKSSGDIEGYGSVKYNEITFTRVAYVMTRRTIFNQNNEVMLIDPRGRDVYVIDMSSYNEESNACFFAKASNSVNWLWYKRLSHLNFKNINKLAIQNFVASVPSLTFSKDKTCSAYEKWKHHRASFKTKRSFSISKCLHLLHMDLFGHVKPQTISHNKYTLVIVDEYSRKMENLNEVRVKEMRSDNGTEFKNHKLEEFYDEKGISQNFSSPCTPAQNGVAERRNKTLIEAARTISIIVKRHGKTAYDVFRGRSPDISYFYVFGCPVHIHNHRDHLRKFDAKADDGFFLGYSLVAKAFREKNTPILQDLNSSDEHPEFTIADDYPVLNEHDDSKLVEDLRIAEDQVSTIIRPVSNVERSPTIISPPVEAGVTTRSRIRDSEAALANECLYVNFLSEIEPKKLIEALEEEGWIIAIKEELNQLERNKVWTLVHIPHGKTIIGIKWIWKNKMDEHGVFVKNKARLEAIRIFLAYAAYIGFMVFQMDVKSDFLNGKISKEVYVQQPPGFESSEFPNHVCKLDKALCGLEQAPRALYKHSLNFSFSISLSEELQNLGLWYSKGSGFDLKAYSDSDYARCNLDRKSTSGGCQILGGKLVCWSAKKQSSVAMSSAEAAYVAATGCCAQVLWIKS
ncbi:retrovirus-related pol polyprotein from transposon TNT 1-94 [Tanacetum coccineum]